MAQRPLVGQDLLVIEALLSYSFRYTTIGRTPLDELSARRRNLYLTIHNTHKRKTFYASDRIRTRNPSKRAASDPILRRHGHLDRPFVFSFFSKYVSASIMTCLVVAALTTVRVAHVTPTPANFESNLSVRDPMWSTKNETPKSSWICLLPLCQGSVVALRKSWDWSTCSFLKWVRPAALQMGTRSPLLDGGTVYTAELLVW